MWGQYTCYQILERFLKTPAATRTKGACVITGTTSGIGEPTSLCMAQAGYSPVFCLVRKIDLFEKAKKEFAESHSQEVADRLQAVVCDLSDLKSVSKACDEIDQKVGSDGKIECLINNAGVMMTPYWETAQGLEYQIGVNHFSHVYLTNRLLPYLKNAGNPENPSRIVCVASEAHKMAPKDGFKEANFHYDEKNKDKYNNRTAYGQSKLANMNYAYQLNKDLKEKSVPVIAVSLHPGVIDTGLGRNSGLANFFYKLSFVFLKTVPQGAATNVYCAIDPEVLNGGDGAYYYDCHKGTPGRKEAFDPEICKSLMASTDKILKDLGFEVNVEL